MFVLTNYNTDILWRILWEAFGFLGCLTTPITSHYELMSVFLHLFIYYNSGKIAVFFGFSKWHLSENAFLDSCGGREREFLHNWVIAESLALVVSVVFLSFTLPRSRHPHALVVITSSCDCYRLWTRPCTEPLLKINYGPL